MACCPVVHVEIDDEYPPPEFRQCSRDVDSVGGFPDSALLISDRDNSCLSLPFQNFTSMKN
jgi:hypothetical protein